MGNEDDRNGATKPRMPAPSGFSHRVPEGDNFSRAVCDTCGFVNYVNPKIVVGSVVTYGDAFLLCRRAIQPRHGFWTLPAGFMEEGETTEDGARREAFEEANARIEIKDLLAVYNIPRISQVQLMYRATLPTREFSAGDESLDVGLFTWDEIPWDDLAFPSVHWALTQYRSVIGKETIVPFSNPTGDRGNQMPGGSKL